MDKRQDTSTNVVDALDLTPMALLEPWLQAQARVISSMKEITDHWYARRCADIATLQNAANRLAACKNTDGFIDAQSQCASALAERFLADVSGLSEDIAAFSTSATSAFGGLGGNGRKRAAS